jgi:hypothetical protein
MLQSLSQSQTRERFFPSLALRNSTIPGPTCEAVEKTAGIHTGKASSKKRTRTAQGRNSGRFALLEGHSEEVSNLCKWKNCFTLVFSATSMIFADRESAAM